MCRHNELQQAQIHHFLICHKPPLVRYIRPRRRLIQYLLLHRLRLCLYLFQLHPRLILQSLVMLLYMEILKILHLHRRLRELLMLKL
jgi:hypothetical protein